GGSHKTCLDVLVRHLPYQWTLETAPSHHWKWRMRGSAAWFANRIRARIASGEGWDLLLATSFLPLTELIGLIPELAAIPRLLYFHENQLAYPVAPGRKDKRDIHFGLSQLVSSLGATVVAFNSEWNRDSFLAEGRTILRKVPDMVRPGWIEEIDSKSRVLYPVVEFPDAALDYGDSVGPDERALGPIILWNHRWEFDKGPDAFFEALLRLQQAGIPFRLAVAGESFNAKPRVFARTKKLLSQNIVQWGFMEDREAYIRLLSRAHIVVSTADHEFFGISMLEATFLGARPVVPDRLSYRELFPAQFRYSNDEALFSTL
ncbi:MAG: DUF3524 domain-containing protein, partial [Myxococcales bacterium]|nr:DUF3524 domain-containing protein [Myxococcales bacterium]